MRSVEGSGGGFRRPERFNAFDALFAQNIGNGMQQQRNIKIVEALGWVARKIAAVIASATHSTLHQGEGRAISPISPNQDNRLPGIRFPC